MFKRRGFFTLPKGTGSLLRFLKPLFVCLQSGASPFFSLSFFEMHPPGHRDFGAIAKRRADLLPHFTR